MSNRNKRQHSDATAPTVRTNASATPTLPRLTDDERAAFDPSIATTPKVETSAEPETTSLEAPTPTERKLVEYDLSKPVDVAKVREDFDDDSAAYRTAHSVIAGPTALPMPNDVEPPAFDGPCFTVNGKLTTPARALIHELRIHVGELIDGIPHRDNTGARCRVDLDGHDACHTCNAIEAAMRTMRVP